MFYIKNIHENKIVIDKSEFIGILYPLTESMDVNDCINDAKKRYPKATHYCSAYIKGPKGEHAGANDDGEPSRTAGIPILEILKHQNLTDCLCVVVRYFGGIKLGAGGLVRAYAQSAKEVCMVADIYEKVYAKHYGIKMNYAAIDKFEYFIKDFAEIISRDFSESVYYEISMIDKDEEIFKDLMHQFISFERLSDIETYLKK